VNETDNVRARRREIATADVVDARRTVRRLLADGSFPGRYESLLGSAGIPDLSNDDMHDMAQQIAAAAAADPLAFAVLSGKRSENELKQDLTGAFDALRTTGPPRDLSVSEIGSLEAISLLTGRPALLVVDDSFSLPEGVWELLAPYSTDISTLLRSVGRLELAPQLGIYAGTVFVVGPGLVMTNRHVLDSLYSATERDQDGRPTAWKFYSGVNPVIEFKGEYGRTTHSRFPVIGIASIFFEDDIGNDIDLALLRLGPAKDGAQPWPTPVRVQRQPDKVRTNAKVCVAGYPDADDRRNDKQEMDRIYGGVYQVKRLAPGQIVDVDSTRKALSHDCTTLGGNSGSCVYDLFTNSVVGLHWGGDYQKPNHAVMLPPLYREGRDARLNDVNFEDD
jgi:hypothetical protein